MTDTEINKGGRPPVELTERQVIEIQALAQYLTKEQISDYLGISRVTFNAILARQEGVEVKYKKGKATAIANVAKGLIGQAMAGNMTAAIFYLKTQAGWKETTVVDNTSSDGTMTPKPATINLSSITDEELRQLNAIATKSKADTSGAGEA